MGEIKESSYKDFMNDRKTSPEMIHSLLLAAQLKAYCYAAYKEGREDGATGEAVYKRLLELVESARKKMEFYESDEELTVGRMLTIARCATKKGGMGMTGLHDKIVYLLLIKPYSDRPIKFKPRHDEKYFDDFYDADLIDLDFDDVF